MLIIRQETIQDYAAVRSLVKKAFAVAEYSDRQEHELVERLHHSAAFKPELSLVTEISGEIIGYILFSEIKIGASRQVALAPLAVLPERQKQGIGSALIKKEHEIVLKQGYEFVVVLGHSGYYPRFGYLPASCFGIQAPFEVPDENFMALNLRGHQMMLNGVVEYDRAFRIP